MSQCAGNWQKFSGIANDQASDKYEGSCVQLTQKSSVSDSNANGASMIWSTSIVCQCFVNDQLMFVRADRASSSMKLKKSTSVNSESATSSTVIDTPITDHVANCSRLLRI